MPARSLTDRSPLECTFSNPRPFVAAQACISHLHGLTSLQIDDISTPFKPASLDGISACLSALEAVSLEFRWADERGLHPLPQDAFPCSLLR